MGTQLYERGVFINRSLEEACLFNASLVTKIHEEYLRAGAQVIETHTFAANRAKLRRHGLEDKIEEINRTAVRLAVEAAKGRAYIAGAVGPTGWSPGLMSDEELGELKGIFEEQAQLMLEEGVELFILETFRLLSDCCSGFAN